MNCSKLTRFPTVSIFHTPSKFQCWAVSLCKNFCDWNASQTIGMSKTEQYPMRQCTIASLITVSEWQIKNHKNNVKIAFHNQNNLEEFLQNLWTLIKHVTNVIDVHNFNIHLDRHIQLKYIILSIIMTKAFTQQNFLHWRSSINYTLATITNGSPRLKYGKSLIVDHNVMQREIVKVIDRNLIVCRSRAAMRHPATLGFLPHGRPILLQNVAILSLKTSLKPLKLCDGQDWMISPQLNCTVLIAMRYLHF